MLTYQHYDPEHLRFETQAQCFHELMNDYIVHAVIKSFLVQRVLDIEFGKGAVTYDLASKFIDAEVIGLSFSPVPAVRKLQNIEHI